MGIRTAVGDGRGDVNHRHNRGQWVARCPGTKPHHELTHTHACSETEGAAASSTKTDTTNAVAKEIKNRASYSIGRKRRWWLGDSCDGTLITRTQFVQQWRMSVMVGAPFSFSTLSSEWHSNRIA